MNNIEKLTRWWPLAALLLVGSIVAALSDLHSLAKYVRGLLDGSAKHINAEICFETDTKCLRSNSNLVDFLSENIGFSAVYEIVISWSELPFNQTDDFCFSGEMPFEFVEGQELIVPIVTYEDECPITNWLAVSANDYLVTYRSKDTLMLKVDGTFKSTLLFARGGPSTSKFTLVSN